MIIVNYLIKYFSNYKIFLQKSLQLMKKYILVGCLLLLSSVSFCQMTKEQYIEKYKDLAIKEMKRTGIPASIKLAQGLLESGYGNSTLAKEAKNHFGLKCHKNWNGSTFYQDDDEKNECFRKYKTVEESYRDHSDYIKNNPRYAFLFELEATDYKGWAYGLKKAGYATNPKYAELLIKTIEDNKLYIYDKENYQLQIEKTSHKKLAREIFENNRVKYIITKEGDTYEKITKELGLLRWQLKKYNEKLDENTILNPGEIVYIQPKRKYPEAGKKSHIVKKGETLYSISQIYAIKLARLCEINKLEADTKLEEGMIIYLRKSEYKKAYKNLNKNKTEAKDNKQEKVNEGENLKFDF